MKRETYSKTKDDASVDMTPMLDIVFIMLIFFIVTTTFANEKGLSANRPPESSNPESSALSVKIDANGQIQMLGRMVDLQLMVANTQTFLANTNSTAAAIQAHEDTEHGVVVDVMDKLKLAGVSSISVIVKKD